ncbi:MAG: YbaB/EbfC family nucleoid-associated protein [Eubacteriales bacterium]|jgi:DNA-binding YbaB/EbfC family protein|nr:YbaB/EbfC family nucleoid-associated protein [Eubacteriales bacterium]MDD4105305.1 YbaB/EbfC family nucleoid-associated protein [Eubacteriales bacterium]MDD4711282.1 YbaB/EbfC family nucleoid-associated protein [Eubacteriales bacterium]NLO15488.1 YbaB/EbfC family nucleoid-associated protein [Clostridiales bacterium]
MAKNQFGGFGGGNMQQLMRQAQKMQEQLAKTQEELEQKEYEATAGGGMVTCTLNGKHQVLQLVIKPEAVDPDDVDMLQDLVIAAVNEAVRMAQEDHEESMGAMAPGGMGGLL